MGNYFLDIQYVMYIIARLRIRVGFYPDPTFEKKTGSGSDLRENRDPDPT